MNAAAQARRQLQFDHQAQASRVFSPDKLAGQRFCGMGKPVQAKSDKAKQNQHDLQAGQLGISQRGGIGKQDRLDSPDQQGA